jgi:hypothetical protein
MERHEHRLTYEGVVYGLRHLHPKNWVLNLSCGTKIPVFIIFSSHCYTDEVCPSDRESLCIPDFHGNDRYFCPKRHALSKQLETWFLSWGAEDCYYSRDQKRGAESWVVVEAANGDQIKVAFDVSPNKKDPTGIMIRVKTVHAYEWSRAPSPYHPYLPFEVLVKGVGLARTVPPVRKRSGP